MPDNRLIYEETTRFFLAPIRPLMDDPAVSEVLVNGPEQIYYEKAGKLHLSDLRFPDEASLMAAVRNIAEYVNRSVDARHHSMDARLPNGSRVHVIIPPCSRVGACISIRKFIKSSFDLQKLVERGSLTAEATEFLELVVLLHKNTVVAGGTGTGKTSLLNALSAAIPAHERIVVIEDSAELQLHQPHTVYLEAQPPRPDGTGAVTIRDLFVDSLRMRPDRIVVEIRRGEALDLIQSMISGHAGSLTTVHATTALDAAIRLETLCLLSGVDLPILVARTQVASALDVVVGIRRLRDGSRKVFNISEVDGLDAEGKYRIRDIYRYQARGVDADGQLLGELCWTGHRPKFAAEPFDLGYEDQIRLTAEVFRPAAAAPADASADGNGR